MSYYQQSFRDMSVWQHSFDFAKGVLRFIKSLPSEDRYNVASSLSRSALSMPAHIAIGKITQGRGDFVKHLVVSQGNAAECETYLLILKDTYPEFADEIARLRDIDAVVQKMLGALIYAIEHPKNSKKSLLTENNITFEPVNVPVAV